MCSVDRFERMVGPADSMPKGHAGSLTTIILANYTAAHPR